MPCLGGFLSSYLRLRLGVRDFAGIASLGLPVYAKGPAALANVHRHLAVEANVPIGCADVLVMPGDIMVGDGDGVVCIPRAQADTVAEGALEQEELEAFVLGKIQAGTPLRGTYPPSAETVAEFEVAAGETVPFVLTHGPSNHKPPKAIDPESALGRIVANIAQSEPPPLILILGSLYLAGEVLLANDELPD